MESLGIRKEYGWELSWGGILPLNLEHGVAMTDEVRVDIDAGSTDLGQRSTRTLLWAFLHFDGSFRGPNGFPSY